MITGKGPDLSAVAALSLDVLVLTDIDYDAHNAALGALASALGGYDHLFALRPNTGMPTGLDLDGDGRLGGPRDAQGYGWFSGQGGMAILSRHPLHLVNDLSALPWRDSHESLGTDEPALQRLSSSAHWAVRVDGPVPLTLLTLAATPPVFDGPTDRNGRRNHDEVLLWAHVMDGRYGPPPQGPVAVIGNFNLDPEYGEGLHDAARAMIAHDRLQDPLPGQPTVTWESVGEMRISYILPDKSLSVTGSGIIPAPAAGSHSIVWVDVEGPE